MSGERPTILVVGDDRDERGAIAAVLRDAGFTVTASHDRGARAAPTRGRFAAAVIALSEDDGVEFRRRLRRGQPGLPVVLVAGPEATRVVHTDDDTLVTRPVDPSHLLRRVFDVVLRGGEDATPRHGDAAELGIAAAKLACLDNRLSAAAASGAQALAHDLTRQIGEARARRRRLAATPATDDPAPPPPTPG